MFRFVITALEAAFLTSMAVAVLAAKRKASLNRYFSLFLALVSLWLLSGFVDRLISQPSTFFVTMQYRLSYAIATFAVPTFFFFGLVFMRGTKPSPWLTRLVYSAASLLAFICFTDMIIRQAEYREGSYLVTNGPFYALFTLYFLLLGGAGFFCISLKRRRSRSIDRSRALYILIGFGIFFVLAFLLTIAIPGMLNRDVTSDYTFLAVIIPAAFTAYAIMRYRLLDVRIAMRRGLAYLLALVLFGIPLLLLYLSLHLFWTLDPALERAIFMIALALIVAFAPALRELCNRLASRFLFASLYDEVGLLHEVSGVLTRNPDIREGASGVAALVCRQLRLEKLAVIIPREIFSGKGDWSMGARREGDGYVDFREIDYSGSPLHRLRQRPLVLEDIAFDEEQPDADAHLRHEMREKGLVACLPIRGTLGEVGTLLVGNKARPASLDPVDLAFLRQLSDRLGIFIENYLLSAYLTAQLEEARKFQKKVEELDQFKTDIINVTSHEFRTPITILNGYALLLRDHCRDFSERQREECIQHITNACQRLTSLLNQFITISRFQRKEAAMSMQVIPVREIFDSLQANLGGEESRRLASEIEGGEISVASDRSYLMMLLKNIVDNAIRFSPPQSPVIMKAEREEGRVRISVRDFGMGMDASQVRNIFNPFDRLEDLDKHQTGTGLGLYIVRLIADLLETEIEVDTRPGEGTEFSFRLPMGPGRSLKPQSQS